MKTATLGPLLTALMLTSAAASARAALYATWSGSQTIPEDPTGLAFDFTLNSPQHAITAVTVALDISGGFNGDLYAFLSHGEGFSILLNRAGRTTANPYGYATPGFAITLSSSASADIHNYQSLSPLYNSSGQLTGTWAADGRDVAPEDSYDTTPSTVALDNFTGLDPNGDWTIFFYDASSGGISTLKSWSVNVTTDVGPVPEPVTTALCFGGTLFALGSCARRFMRRPGA